MIAALLFLASGACILVTLAQAYKPAPPSKQAEKEVPKRHIDFYA